MHVWDGIFITVTPTFIFHIERVIELTPCCHTGPSECPGVKGQLQNSLTGQHDLSVIHQLQTFRAKSLKKNHWWILHFLYSKKSLFSIKDSDGMKK